MNPMAVLVIVMISVSMATCDWCRITLSKNAVASSDSLGQDRAYFAPFAIGHEVGGWVGHSWVISAETRSRAPGTRE